MRKQYFLWTLTVGGIIGTAYGGYSLIYNANNDKPLSIYGLVLLILGAIALIFAIISFISIYITRKKRKEEILNETTNINEEVMSEAPIIKEEDKKVEVSENKAEISNTKEREYIPRSQRTSVSYSRYDSSTVYVKQVGQGTILRIDGGRVLDMRTNTYYRIENNIVNREGYGPLFEIRGNQIKDVFGGYLYGLSGGNINKVYGGFYASISGNYITLFDLSIKFEMTDSLSKNQLLAIIAILFGKY